jgi:monooxygenase
MERHGVTVAMPKRDAAQAEAPFPDLSAGYVQRAAQLLPNQGQRRQWRVHQNYLRDLVALRWRRIDDGVLRSGRPGQLPKGRATRLLRAVA